MATLVRWDPLRGVGSLHAELSRLMNGLDGLNDRQAQGWVPSWTSGRARTPSRTRSIYRA